MRAVHRALRAVGIVAATLLISSHRHPAGLAVFVAGLLHGVGSFANMIAQFSISVYDCNYRMSGSGRTTIIGMLLLAERSLSAPQLIRLASPLGLSATNVKSHLTRMVAEGVLRREGSVRLAVYAPSADQ